jgi:hypothetical protein
MNLINASPLTAGVTLATDKHGFENVLVIAKGTFDWVGECWSLSSKPVPLVRADQFFGKPGMSSIRYESDFAAYKPYTDLIVNGSAYAPEERPATVVEIGIEAGPIRKRIRVVGERVWMYSFAGGWSVSDPRPFQSMPVTYERAFGGADRSDPDERKHVFEPTNLVGTGIHSRLESSIEGSPLPNLELRSERMRKPTDRIRSVGLGFIGRNWLPRRDYAGTYDTVWLEHRFPYLPRDFDDQYHQGAPADQICPRFQEGEVVTLTNLTPDGHWRFPLPRYDFDVLLRYRYGSKALCMTPDTVVIEPDLRRCLITWRGTARLEAKATDLFEIWVGISSGRKRAFLSHKRYISRQSMSAIS